MGVNVDCHGTESVRLCQIREYPENANHPAFASRQIIIVTGGVESIITMYADSQGLLLTPEERADAAAMIERAAHDTEEDRIMEERIALRCEVDECEMPAVAGQRCERHR